VPLSFSSLFPPISVVAETFADGPALFDAVCKLGLEGVAAKRLSSRYRANQRGWVKTKNRTTGVATPSARRCSARGSVVSELACSAYRALIAKPPSSAVALREAEACAWPTL
jgi:ATP-dependent DNA ligase